MYREIKGIPTTELAGGIVAEDKRLGEDAYDHDYNTGDFAYPDGRSVVEVGPHKTMLVRLGDVRELPQIREVIREKEIEDLARAIIADSDALQQAQTPEEISTALDLMHPPELIMLQPDELEVYLADHADFYELEEPVVIPHDNLPVMLQNAGHRRKRAIEYIIVKMKGLTLQDVAVRCTVHEGMTFAQANRRQAKENSHVQTSALEDAHNIIRQYKFIQRREGRRPLVSEIADIYGFSADKVRTALAYDSLPDSVKAFTGEESKKEVLSYSLVADLGPLMDLYERRYEKRSAAEPAIYPIEGRDERVETDLKAFAAKLARKKIEKVRSGELRNLLEIEKKSVLGSIAVTAENLFLFEVEKSSPRERMITAYTRLGQAGLNGVEHAAAQGALGAEEIERIEQLLALAKSLAQPAVPDNQEAMF